MKLSKISCGASVGDEMCNARLSWFKQIKRRHGGDTHTKVQKITLVDIRKEVEDKKKNCGKSSEKTLHKILF